MPASWVLEYPPLCPSEIRQRPGNPLKPSASWHLDPTGDLVAGLLAVWMVEVQLRMQAPNPRADCLLLLLLGGAPCHQDAGQNAWGATWGGNRK
jgi:hypothetical protein